MKVVIFSDGGSRGNPGEPAIGFVIKRGDQILMEYAEPIGIATNNVAEYRAALKAIRTAKQLGASSVELFLDSELIQRQLTGVYKVKNEDLLEYYKMIVAEIADFDFFSAVHVKRAFNKDADRLVNEALDLNRIVDRRITEEIQGTEDDSLKRLTLYQESFLPKKKPESEIFSEERISIGVGERNGDVSEALLQNMEQMPLAPSEVVLSKIDGFRALLEENKIEHGAVLETEGICTIYLSIEALQKFARLITEEKIRELSDNKKIKIRLELEE